MPTSNLVYFQVSFQCRIFDSLKPRTGGDLDFISEIGRSSEWLTLGAGRAISRLLQELQNELALGLTAAGGSFEGSMWTIIENLAVSEHEKRN